MIFCQSREKRLAKAEQRVVDAAWRLRRAESDLRDEREPMPRFKMKKVVERRRAEAERATAALEEVRARLRQA